MERIVQPFLESKLEIKTVIALLTNFVNPILQYGTANALKSGKWKS